MGNPSASADDVAKLHAGIVGLSSKRPSSSDRTTLNFATTSAETNQPTKVMSQSICDICVGALEYRRNPISADTSMKRLSDGKEVSYLPNSFGHHRSWESLHASIATECWICSRIPKQSPFAISPLSWQYSRSGYGEIYTQNLRLHDYVTTISITVPDSDGCAKVRVYYVQGDDCDEQALKLVFTMIQVSGRNVQSTISDCMAAKACRKLEPNVLNSKPDEAESTGSPRSLSTGREWIGNCLKNHKRCNYNADKDPWYPTRLIDLGGPAESSELVHLIVTNECSIHGPYATLSHCWGRNVFTKLMKATLHELRSGICLENLPKTFKEAILVCRALQIRYIWIDSLCIMQDKDDLRDWTIESSLMHNVYTRSHLNISAANAQDGTYGLFRDRSASVLEQTKIKATLVDADGVLDSRYYAIEDPVYWYHHFGESHIHTRGWVFQERLMAPRVLHFAKEQLAWECQESSACEKYPDDIPLLFMKRANFKSRFAYEVYIRRTERYGFDADAADFIYKLWNSLITDYSLTKLTQPSDKLMALSGLAKSLGIVTEDEYIAGLWRRNLEQQLLWYAFDGRYDETTRSQEYRAPSWSWASMNALIMMNLHPVKSSQVKAHITRVDVVHVSDDPTGQIRDASIDVEGELRPMSIRQDPESHLWYMTVHQDHGEHLLDFFRVDERKDASPTIGCDQDARLFYMIFIVTETQIKALLLRLVQGESEFVRWGMISIDHEILEPGDLELQEALLTDIDEATKAILPCLRYEGGKHTIRIV